MISRLRFAVFASILCFAGTSGAAPDETTSGTAVGNKTCPVMEGKALNDKAKMVTHKGQVVGVCCKRCVKTFSEKPDEYLKKAQDLAKAGK